MRDAKREVLARYGWERLHDARGDGLRPGGHMRGERDPAACECGTTEKFPTVDVSAHGLWDLFRVVGGGAPTSSAPPLLSFNRQMGHPTQVRSRPSAPPPRAF